VERYLHRLEELLWPDLFVIGGGVSRKSGKWLPFIELRTPTVPAELRNAAGIVGSAMAAARLGGSERVAG
jgi:polyphosphate glucokinase